MVRGCIFPMTIRVGYDRNSLRWTQSKGGHETQPIRAHSACPTVIQYHFLFCVGNKPILLIPFRWHKLTCTDSWSVTCLCFVMVTLPSPIIVFQFCLVFIWILLTLAGEVIEDFLRHERGEHDVTATPSEPIIKTETVLTHHLVNGGGKTLSCLTFPRRI
jgi:hypothetical protein